MVDAINFINKPNVWTGPNWNGFQCCRLTGCWTFLPFRNRLHRQARRQITAEYNLIRLVVFSQIGQTIWFYTDRKCCPLASDDTSHYSALVTPDGLRRKSQHCTCYILIKLDLNWKAVLWFRRRNPLKIRDMSTNSKLIMTDLGVLVSLQFPPRTATFWKTSSEIPTWHQCEGNSCTICCQSGLSLKGPYLTHTLAQNGCSPNTAYPKYRSRLCGQCERVHIWRIGWSRTVIVWTRLIRFTSWDSAVVRNCQYLMHRLKQGCYGLNQAYPMYWLKLCA
jgi:hypothetical protein